MGKKWKSSWCEEFKGSDAWIWSTCMNMLNTTLDRLSMVNEINV